MRREELVGIDRVQVVLPGEDEAHNVRVRCLGDTSFLAGFANGKTLTLPVRNVVDTGWPKKPSTLQDIGLGIVLAAAFILVASLFSAIRGIFSLFPAVRNDLLQRTSLIGAAVSAGLAILGVVFSYLGIFSSNQTWGKNEP